MSFHSQFPALLISHLMKEKYLIIPAPLIFLSSLRTAISIPATKTQPTNQQKFKSWYYNKSPMEHSSETGTSMMGVSCTLSEGILKYIHLQNICNTSWRHSGSSLSLLSSRNLFQVKMIVARSIFLPYYP